MKPAGKLPNLGNLRYIKLGESANQRTGKLTGIDIFQILTVLLKKNVFKGLTSFNFYLVLKK